MHSTRNHKVLRVILSGGLGNQLFQYATGRAISEAQGAELVLDTISGFKDDTVYKRQYELDVFPGPKACRKAVEPSKRVWWWLRIRQRKRISILASLWKIIDERLVEENSRNLALHSGENLLIGFWQDEQYFREIREILRKELCLKVSEPFAENAVALHVRRVQYTRGVEEDYFIKAMTLIRERVVNPHFHLFTDDLEWGRGFAREIKDVTLASAENSGALEDFRTMTQFSHWILANSTFSWWAAWLGEHPDSVVVIPSSIAWPNKNTPITRWINVES